MAHREDIRELLEEIEVYGQVIDWGSGAKPVKNYVQGEANFYTIDKNKKTDPSKTWDILKPIKLKQADYAFCMEVLEHTTDPLAVLQNIYSNLKKGGKLYLSVPFLYPEHGDEDYLRLTSQGLKYFLNEAGFNYIKIIEISDGFFAEAEK